MQFINNLDVRTRRLLLIGALLTTGIFLAVVLVLSDKPQQSGEGTGQYYDTGSGETVSSPIGKTPENYGEEQDKPLYLGFSKLPNYGVTQNQVEALKLGLAFYSGRRSEKITEVSLQVATISAGAYNEDSGERILTFDLQVNRKDMYQATMVYKGLRSAKLSLAKDGTEKYASDYIDPTAYEEAGD